MRRTWCLALYLGVLLLLLGLCPVAVADNPKDHGDKATAAHGAGTDEDPFGRSLDLAIWTWVVFLLLFFLLKKYAWGPILEGLKKREQNIHAAAEEARRAREEAEEMRRRFQSEMDKASEKVREMMDEARRDAQHTKDEMVSAARKEIQTERERLLREVDMARDQALQDIWTRSAELATLISTKVIGRQLSAEDHTRMVDEAIADLQNAGKERQREVVSVQ